MLHFCDFGSFRLRHSLGVTVSHSCSVLNTINQLSTQCLNSKLAQRNQVTSAYDRQFSECEAILDFFFFFFFAGIKTVFSKSKQVQTTLMLEV